MFKYTKKRVLRNLVLAKKIKSGYRLLFISLISKIPFFKRIFFMDKDKYKLKLNLINRKKNVGHALSWRKISLYFLRIKLLEIKLEEGLSATIDQFYFNRSLSYIKKFVNLNLDIQKILNNGYVFDPGCGCGKHLLYLKDKYNSKIFGVDVYAPAIEAAKTADYLNEGNFINDDTLNLSFLKKNINKKIDILLIDSWLKHVIENPNLSECMEYIIQNSSFALLVKGKKEEEVFYKFFNEFKVICKLDTPESQIVYLDLKN